MFAAKLQKSIEQGYFEEGDAWLRKSAHRRACALGRAWRCFRYKDIDHRLKCEH
jgi:hypothetical protein